MDKQKKQYSFLGRPVGRSCLCAILGIGKERFNKCLSLQPDLRIGKDKSGSQRCTASVDAFLSIMYNGVAETLPDRLPGCKVNVIHSAVMIVDVHSLCSDGSQGPYARPQVHKTWPFFWAGGYGL